MRPCGAALLAEMKMYEILYYSTDEVPRRRRRRPRPVGPALSSSSPSSSVSAYRRHLSPPWDGTGPASALQVDRQPVRRCWSSAKTHTHTFFCNLSWRPAVCVSLKRDITDYLSFIKIIKLLFIYLSTITMLYLCKRASLNILSLIVFDTAQM